MKIAVFGAGGVGAYFGGRLAQAGADVHLIARGDHLHALRESGLTVHSVSGDFEVELPATDDPATIGPCDIVLFTVKSTDTEPAAESLDPLLGPETAVLSLQNGVANEERIAAEIGAAHVMGGVAYIFSTIAEPGVIEHTGGPTRFVFGELDGDRTERAERFLELCREADIDATLTPDIRSALWDKFVFICAHSGMTAATRLPIGPIRESPPAWTMYQRLMKEGRDVASAEGVRVSEEVLDDWLDLAREMDPEMYSSLHYDLIHEKPMELDTLNRDVVRRADEHGVAVPMNRAIQALLSPWASRFARD